MPSTTTQVLWHYLNQFVSKDENPDLLYYEYNYGDGWLHEIHVSDQDRSNLTAAELIDGSGACPPENYGGLRGYQHLKDYLSDKMDSQEYYDWFSP